MHPPTRKFATISTQEIIHLLVSGVLIGVILSWRDWGAETFDPVIGLTSLIFSVIVAICLLMLRLAVMKKFAYRLGYFLDYQVHKYGVMTSIVLAFFFNGLVPYVTPGELSFKESKGLRLGAFRKGPNFGDFTKIVLAGTLVGILLMLLIKPLYFISQNFFIYKVIQVTAAITFFSLIPIPGADGFHMIYFRRWIWIFVIFFVGVYFSLILFAGVFSYFIALAISCVATWFFLKNLD